MFKENIVTLGYKVYNMCNTYGTNSTKDKVGQIAVDY